VTNFKKTVLTPNEALIQIAKDELHQVYRQTIFALGNFRAPKEWLLNYTIYFSGLEHQQKNLITAYGQPMLLTNVSFILLATMSLNLFTYRSFPLAGRTNVWTHKTELFDRVDSHEENTARYIHRLKSEIRSAGIVTTEIIANDKNGNYSVLWTVTDLIFNLDRLAKHSDARISAPASNLLRLYSKT